MGQRGRWLAALGLLCALARPAAAASSGANFTAFDAGLFANNVVDRVSALQADKSAVSHFSVYVRVRRGLHLGKGFFLEPAFATLVPWLSGKDGSTKQFLFHTDFPFLVPIFSFLRLRAGLGVEWRLLTSSGGAVILDNGTGTQIFYTPGGVRLAAVTTLSLGLEVRVSHKIGFNLDTAVLSLLNRSRRSFQASASLGVYL